MKTQFVITSADPIFMAAFMETMAAMQAEKDQGDEAESFVARFPDFESADLKWIRDESATVLAKRSAMDNFNSMDYLVTILSEMDEREIKGVIQDAEIILKFKLDTKSPQSESFSESTSTQSTTELPQVFRYFRNPEGDEWKMNIDCKKGFVRQAGKTEWDASCSKLTDFIHPDGKVCGHYMEILRDMKLWPRIRIWSGIPPFPRVKFIAAPEITSILGEGLELAQKGGTQPQIDIWIKQAEEFMLRNGLKPATLHIPPVSQDQASS